MYERPRLKHTAGCLHGYVRRCTILSVRSRRLSSVSLARSPALKLALARVHLNKARATHAAPFSGARRSRGLNLSGDENLARNIPVTPLSAFRGATRPYTLPRAPSGCIKPELTKGRYTYLRPLTCEPPAPFSLFDLLDLPQTTAPSFSLQRSPLPRLQPVLWLPAPRPARSPPPTAHQAICF